MADSQKYVATNVFDINNPNVLNGYIDSSGNYVPYATNGTLYVPITAGTSYTVSGIIRASQSTVVRIATFTAIPSTQTASVNLYTLNQGDSITITAGNNENYLFVMFCGDSDYNAYGSVQAALTTNCANLHIDTYGWVHSLRKLTTATEAVENPLYTDGTAITAYTIKGNTVQSGTPTPSNPVDVNGVGERTENLFDDTNVINIPNLGDRYGVELPSGTYSIYNDTDNTVYYGTNNWTGRQKACDAHSTVTVELRVGSETQVGGFFIALNSASQGGCTIVEGSTPPDHYIPYGYKIPISNGLQTIDIYIGDLPLLKSLDGTAVDEISNGTLTRRVDSDGSVLPTPTTTQITMPSIPTTDGANSITVDTTVQPSEFTATWTGWHNAYVKEYDGSDWQ